MDPFTLGALGIGALGSLIGGIQSASELPRQKRQYLEDLARQQRLEAIRHGRWTQENTHQKWDDLYPDWIADMRLKKEQGQHYADAAFKWNPTSLLPFVQSATKLAGGIYDYANQAPTTQEPYQATGALKLDQPTSLLASSEYMRPAGAALGALSYYDETKPYYDPKNFDPNDLVYHGPVGDNGRDSWDYGAGRTKRWWED